MSKIEFEQISENEVEVVIPPETPMTMVAQLTKSFAAKGLVEDLAKSTLSVRYFVRPEDSVNQAADKLIKSLQNLAKDELPYWHPKAQFANQKRVREMEIAERRAKNGVKQPSNVSTAPEPHVMPDAVPKMPAPAATAKPMNAATSTAPKMYDHDPANQMTAGGTGKRYAFITDPANKSEDEDDDVEKSNYGPKGGGQYSLADNIRRKARNTGESYGEGPNTNAKAYSTKPGQLSAKQAATVESKKLASMSRKNPVKTFTPEEIAAENKKRGLNKAWGQHLPFPSAEEEILNLAKQTVQSGEDAAANSLAQMMHSKALLSNFKQPSSQEFEAAGEAMGMGVSEEMAKNAEQQWNGTINNWLAEASKPISQRFSSEEEEMAYWSKIKVSDSGGDHGY